jgi:hypothetical protein
MQAPSLLELHALNNRTNKKVLIISRRIDMYKDKKLKVQVNIYIPMEIRERLQIVAAKKMLQNPQKAQTAAGIAGEYIINNIKIIEQENTNND